MVRYPVLGKRRADRRTRFDRSLASPWTAAEPGRSGSQASTTRRRGRAASAFACTT